MSKDLTHDSAPPSDGSVERFLFPKWSNHSPTIAALLTLVGGTAVIGGLWYYAPNKYFEVGYTPVQPVEYSHKLHAGDLGMDCRYCHSTVERSSFAAVPATEVCMNCHSKVKTESPNLAPVRESYANDTPIPWIKVHNLPDYVYFNHSAHLGAGVGCSTCHGRVDQMIRVGQVSALSMGWCLECHRNPGPALRKHEDVTNMAWQPPDEGSPEYAAAQANPVTKDGEGRKVNPPVHCSGCHR